MKECSKLKGTPTERIHENQLEYDLNYESFQV